MSDENLSIDDVQAIADAVAMQMLSLPRELGAFLERNRTMFISLAPLEASPGLNNVQLRIQTDADGMWFEFMAQGNQRLAALRFNYREWAWHRFDTPQCPVCKQDHRIRTNKNP